MFRLLDLLQLSWDQNSREVRIRTLVRSGSELSCGPDQAQLRVSGMSPGVSLSPVGGLLWFQGRCGLQPCRQPLSIRTARLGSALQILQAPGLSSGSGSLQGRGTAPDLRSVSSHASAMVPLDSFCSSGLGSGSAPWCRRAAASHLPSFFFLFSFYGRRAEAAGRKEGGKKTRGA